MYYTWWKKSIVKIHAKHFLDYDDMIVFYESFQVSRANTKKILETQTGALYINFLV